MILGLNAYHPDASAAIVVDGRLVAAAEEERFLRVKHWAGFPRESIAYCLREAGLGLEDVGVVALNRNPKANLCRKAGYVLCRRPPVGMLASRFQNMCKIGGVRQELAQAFPRQKLSSKVRVVHVEHHRAHLASAFLVSPFARAAVVSIDGFGDFTSCMVARGRDSRLSVLSQVCFPHSLGLFYTALTQYLGFRKFGDEYKVMGLAAYGTARYADKMEQLVRLLPRGKFALALKYFSFHRKSQAMLWNNAEPVLEDLYAPALEKLLGPARAGDEGEVSQYHCDLAASAQAMYEKAFFHVLAHAQRITGEEALCLAGGCALNSVANGKIFGRTSFREVYIQPGSSDAGGALGAAFYVWNHQCRKPRSFSMTHAYWGPHFDRAALQGLLEESESLLEGSTLEVCAQEDELCRKAAERIAAGDVVGWFQGRMEWGARALGNRSILADPRRAQMKDVINARIKRRESFRPFAPSILEERVGEYFEIAYPDPFMVKVYPVRPEKRGIIPAVTHVDGSGRLQTVSREQNPRYWKLIKAFESITGVPVLLNTSFNENEPVVCTPQEALACFLRTNMDVLILGDTIISRQGRKA